MGKKKAASPKRTASKSTKSKSSSSRSSSGKRSSRHTQLLLEMAQEERSSYFRDSPANTLLKVFEESYLSALVNVLLDMKRSEVRRLFERLVLLRKRVMIPALTLYQYKEYLINPLPLTISSTNGLDVPNYYSILGIPRESSAADLKEAHKLLSRAYAPEALSPSARKAGRETLKDISNAYDALKSPKKRAQTDVLLPNISYLYPRRDQSWLEAVRWFLD